MKCYLLTFASFAFLQLVVAQNADTAFRSYSQKLEGTSLSFKMVPVQGGNFKMGSSPQDKSAEPDEIPGQSLRISPFWMGAHEVTYEAFDAYMQDEAISQNSKVDAITRPSQPYIDLTLGMGKSGGAPANSMQQYGALMYCRWLYQNTGVFYRLPSEAEWEYACRAGSTSVYPFGNDSKDLSKYAWYKGNSNNEYHNVGELQPNAWGLYDMIGNVAEWTLDQYDETYFKKLEAGAADPLIVPGGRNPRTVRGGSFKDEPKDLRSADRKPADPIWNRRDPQIPKSYWWNADAPFVGFRLVRPLKQPSPAEVETFFKSYLGQ
ncbi:MAG: SUMF1/EgtB/PvdO family nonheme iron enzyme [Chitinophagaceae bacterium]